MRKHGQLKIYSGEDLLNEYNAHREKMNKSFKVRKDGIEIKIRYPYFIEWSRISTKDMLLKWVFHLSEKSWMDIEYLREFIDRVCKYNNWNVYVQD